MSWTRNSPDGTRSVKQNFTPMNANTGYTEDTMNIDHYWNEGANLDGHHQFAQMPATNIADKSLATNPSLAPGCDLVFFDRFKAAGEYQPGTNQDAQPFCLNNTAIMQILGIRAMAVFTVADNGNVPQTIVYQHNVDTVTRTSTGRFLVTYSVPFPADCKNYLVLGGGFSSKPIDTPVYFGVTGNALSSKNENSCLINLWSMISTNPFNPNSFINQGWLICFGG